jgi:hypothetical protein
VGLRQDVMSAMARRDFFPQGPPPYWTFRRWTEVLVWDSSRCYWVNS